MNHIKGEIGGHGYIRIERLGQMELMQCIHKHVSCGGDCVCFGEPSFNDERKQTIIPICYNQFLTFNTFTDKRAKYDESK